MKANSQIRLSSILFVAALSCLTASGRADKPQNCQIPAPKRTCSVPDYRVRMLAKQIWLIKDDGQTVPDEETQRNWFQAKAVLCAE